MKIRAFNGSIRGSNGNTHLIVEQFLRGAARAGADGEEFFLNNHLIEECRACMGCWLKTPGRCLVEDDMPDLQDKFMASDMVVLATPLYVDNMTGLMKLFLDRLIPIVDPMIEKDPEGEYRHRKRYETYPKLVIVSNCGFPEQSQFQALRVMFHRVARNMHTEIVGEICRGQGELLHIREPFVQKSVDAYFEWVRQAGREVVEQGRISSETAQKLEEPLMDDEQYVMAANSSYARKLEK